MTKRRATPKTEAAAPPRIVLIDANVFFAPRMRDLVMHLHQALVINVQWTREIEAEWTRNVVAKHGAEADAIQACLRGMRDAVEGWEVTGYKKHIARFGAVNAKDRDVGAGAYQLSLEDWPGQAVALVTQNLKDFPVNSFEGTEVTLYSLGSFIDALYETEPARVTAVAESCRKKLKDPPFDRERYVALLMRHRCMGAAEGLGKTWGVECPKMKKDGALYYV